MICLLRLIGPEWIIFDTPDKPISTLDTKLETKLDTELDTIARTQHLTADSLKLGRSWRN